VNVDLTRTLTEIEGDDWGEPPYPSHLVVTCHRLRHKPLASFTIEDLRILVGQSFSLDVLYPLALRALEQEPLAGGDFYDGDLLMAALTVKAQWLSGHPAERSRVLEVYRRARELLIDDDCDTSRFDEVAASITRRALAPT
jgi:hypothetical protein